MPGASLLQADLSGADFRGANIHQVKLEDALSLKNTDLRGVKGLSDEQKAACKARGAVIDKDVTTTLAQPSASSPTPPQNTDTQTSSAQTNPPPTDANRSSSSVAQQSNATQTSEVATARVTTPPANTDGSSSFLSTRHRIVGLK